MQLMAKNNEWGGQINGRMIKVEMNYKGYNLVIVGACAPSEDEKDGIKDKSYNDINCSCSFQKICFPSSVVDVPTRTGSASSFIHKIRFFLISVSLR